MSRNVYIETRPLGPGPAFHWAVGVGDSRFEVSGKGYRNNMVILEDKVWDYSFSKRILSGSTYKTNGDIKAFNKRWVEKHPYYNVLDDNCQKYALDLARFLIGSTFEMPFFPQTGFNSWADASDEDELSGDGFYRKKSTKGKAGIQAGTFSAEVEGPMSSTTFASTGSNRGVMLERSLARAEVKVGPVGVRVEPNINTGVGLKGGQGQVKLLGFGVSAGARGFGISTPLGTFGFGTY